MNGKMITVEDVNPSCTVRQLKQQLQQREGLAPEQQRLIVNGQQMRDEDKLSDYNLNVGFRV
ncbi:hypothetical protein, conserved [Eimeria necatrix]|uniref:Ubiquitin-like domain-containing protein n=1 Tax=Eimeria necatrix TaxID=51315 RepID=U6MXT1_9EIME|nr:hypothetical protein, conserved [Eimeria necatrix]CDJ68771.1 hypothetical protein, conserved [Eimeria necatrix]